MVTLGTSFKSPDPCFFVHDSERDLSWIWSGLACVTKITGSQIIGPVGSCEPW